MTLKTAKRLTYAAEPKILGEHLRKRPYELGLYQKDAAAQLGVNEWTLIGWEKGRKRPTIRFWPGIIKFLGYHPFPEPRTLGERLRAARRRLGLSEVQMARAVHLDEGTVRLLETERRTPNPVTRTKIERGLLCNLRGRG